MLAPVTRSQRRTFMEASGAMAEMALSTTIKKTPNKWNCFWNIISPDVHPLQESMPALAEALLVGLDGSAPC